MGYGATEQGAEDATFLVGIFGDVFALLYYLAPLSSACRVVSSRDASSLYTPMILLNLLNASLWFFYGLLGDNNNVIIWFPNVIGISLSVMQLSLVCLFSGPQQSSQQSTHYIIPSAADVSNPIVSAASSEDLPRAGVGGEGDSSGCVMTLASSQMESMEIGGLHKRSF